MPVGELFCSSQSNVAAVGSIGLRIQCLFSLFRRLSECGKLFCLKPLNPKKGANAICGVFTRFGGTKGHSSAEHIGRNWQRRTMMLSYSPSGWCPVCPDRHLDRLQIAWEGGSSGVVGRNTCSLTAFLKWQIYRLTSTCNFSGFDVFQ